mmetsp:Transcript_57569/g.180331  ORF Transcript_57569/g.180331 Transcript_57569/m.180331 type:complete len:227 (+) Transcript_57569:235-915(+)
MVSGEAPSVAARARPAALVTSRRSDAPRCGGDTAVLVLQLAAAREALGGGREVRPRWRGPQLGRPAEPLARTTDALPGPAPLVGARRDGPEAELRRVPEGGLPAEGPASARRRGQRLDGPSVVRALLRRPHSAEVARPPPPTSAAVGPGARVREAVRCGGPRDTARLAGCLPPPERPPSGAPRRQPAEVRGTRSRGPEAPARLAGGRRRPRLRVPPGHHRRLPPLG